MSGCGGWPKSRWPLSCDGLPLLCWGVRLPDAPSLSSREEFFALPQVGVPVGSAAAVPRNSDPAFRAFGEGRPLPLSERPTKQDWMRSVANACAQGKRIYRVYVLDQPLTPYLPV